MNPLPQMYCLVAMDELRDCKNFGETFVHLKMHFFRTYQSGVIFSTRFGAEFFNEVYYRIVNNKPIVAEKGSLLGEFDKNFNAWLKTVVND